MLRRVYRGGGVKCSYVACVGRFGGGDGPVRRTVNRKNGCSDLVPRRPKVSSLERRFASEVIKKHTHFCLLREKPSVVLCFVCLRLWESVGSRVVRVDVWLSLVVRRGDPTSEPAVPLTADVRPGTLWVVGT